MKSNNKVLGIIFFFLLGLLVAKKTILKPTVRSFKTELTAFTPETIDKITIQLEGQPLTTLTKSDDKWLASNGTITVEAKEGSVSGLTREFSNIKTKQLVSRDPAKQQEYEVDETKGRVIKFYSGSKQVTGIVVGRFNFNQQTRSGLSYARNIAGEDIYALDGFLSMSASRDFNSFRINKLLPIEAGNIESVTLEEAGEKQTLTKTLDKQWQKNDQVIDSTKAATYVTTLMNMTGTEFNDDFTAANATQINTINIGEAKVSIYQDPTGSFVIKSNQNDAYFNSDSTGLFKKLVLDFKELR